MAAPPSSSRGSRLSSPPWLAGSLSSKLFPQGFHDVLGHTRNIGRRPPGTPASRYCGTACTFLLRGTSFWEVQRHKQGHFNLEHRLGSHGKLRQCRISQISFSSTACNKPGAMMTPFRLNSSICTCFSNLNLRSFPAPSGIGIIYTEVGSTSKSDLIIRGHYWRL